MFGKYLFEKTNFIRNLSNTFNISEEKRMERVDGFCGGESIGYLKYISKKLQLKSNPEIVNYNHTPQNLWAIYNTNFNDSENDTFVLLNYPGDEINLQLEKSYNGLFEIKDIYFYSTISNKIKFLNINDPDLNLLKIEFYELDKNGLLSKVKSLILKKSKDKKKFQLNLNLDEFNKDEHRLFIKLINNNNSKVNITFQNKFLINEYKILNKFMNCYVLKND